MKKIIAASAKLAEPNSVVRAIDFSCVRVAQEYPVSSLPSVSPEEGAGSKLNAKLPG